MDTLVLLTAQALVALLTAAAGWAVFSAAALRKRLLDFEEETKRALDALRREADALRCPERETDEEAEKKARAERLFTEGLSSILAYDLSPKESKRV
ncbi:MAG: hypothetical protein GX189_00015 [Clostridiales bacterium]|nr:hypothetical protein [Clostridiales bacterium]